MKTYETLPADTKYDEEVFNKIAVAVREHSEMSAAAVVPFNGSTNAYNNLMGSDLENAQRQARKAHQFSTLLVKLMDGDVSTAQADAEYSRIKNR